MNFAHPRSERRRSQHAPGWSFAETEESRAKRRDIAAVHHVRAALRNHASTSHCTVTVSAEAGRVKLGGIVADNEQRRACADIASRIKGLAVLENLLRVADVPPRMRGDG